MEVTMRDIALQLAGALAILAALAHGVLGETVVFPRARIDPPWVMALVRVVWHCLSVAWIGGGVLLIATPSFATDGSRRWLVAVLAAVYASAALGNAVATGGRHFGWMVLSAVVVLALIGI
jgi:hypothetical protein